MKLRLWLAANVVILVLVPTLTFVFLQAEIKEAHRANPHLSGDGDSLGIPMVGNFLFTLLILLAINGTMGLKWWLQKRRQLRL